MKKLLLAAVVIITVTSCKQIDQEKEMSQTTSDDVNVVKVDLSKYPDDLNEVFLAHGGLDKWNAMKTLTYTMPSNGAEETHITDLKSRAILIENDNYQLGFDGDKLWIEQDSTVMDAQRATFYHNLMFYFYAMPFVLADDGITYTEVPALEMNDISYPGIKVSYMAGVGYSPDDEYILYLDPESHQMAWLGYTVTFGKDGKSDRYSYIKYNKWQEVNGLLLPVELTWYNVENGKPTTARGPARVFTKVDIDANPMDDQTYQKTAAGVYLEDM